MLTKQEQIAFAYVGVAYIMQLLCEQPISVLFSLIDDVAPHQQNYHQNYLGCKNKWHFFKVERYKKTIFL